MDLNDLISRYKIIHQYFFDKYPTHTKEFRILARLNKISEELGELNSSVHSELGMQRQEKLDAHSTDDIAMEWADLYSTVMLFGVLMEIDMPKALDKRVTQIFDRYNLEEPKA